MNLDIWKNASPCRQRILLTVIILVISLLITGLGTLVPIGAEDASQIRDDLSNAVESMMENNGLVQYIFGNNFLICLLMFVPIFGPIFGFFVLFNTGTVIGAIAVAEGSNPILTVIALFLFPAAWLEFAAYSAALAESFWLIRRTLQGLGKHELKNGAILISLTAVLLLSGAIIEAVFLLSV